MKLLERSRDLALLRAAFDLAEAGQGQTVFICGEAGMGKTALIREFLSDREIQAKRLEGFCDSLFAARPLGPMLDMAPELGEDIVRRIRENPDRSFIFPTLLEALRQLDEPAIMVIEDIHWADEATLDFIRFLARRVRQLPCLFVLTLRDNELPPTHPYMRLLGDLPPTDFQKIVLAPLSRDTVASMADKVGRSPDEVYELTAGIPYYVSEVLANYHKGIPESVRDSILSLYHRQFDTTKELWETISVIPGRIDLAIVRAIYPSFSKIVDFCFNARILILEGNAISFKHELFRTTIEESLSPVRRKELHQIVADAMSAVSESEDPAARIIHHARLAGDRRKLQELSPVAAQEASLLGSHYEAMKLYSLALESAGALSREERATLWEKYSYECYLTHAVSEAIAALENARALWGEEDLLHKGNVQRQLSGLYWIAGDAQKAETLAKDAIQLTSHKPESKELGQAYSHMACLMMYMGNWSPCLEWSNKAVALGEALRDPEILCPAYTCVGTVHFAMQVLFSEGQELIERSLSLALEHHLHEHAARAYLQLGSGLLDHCRFSEAEEILKEGIAYCEEHDLRSGKQTMECARVHVLLRSCKWNEARALCAQVLAEMQLQDETRVIAEALMFSLSLRTGEDVASLPDGIYTVLKTTSDLRCRSTLLAVILEEMWMSGQTGQLRDEIVRALREEDHLKVTAAFRETQFWCRMLGTESDAERIGIDGATFSKDAIRHDPLLQALNCIEGTEDEMREGLRRLLDLGAMGTARRFENVLKESGIRHLPRGPRTSTAENSAGLTQRQMDVLTLLAEGFRNKEIAGQLFVSAKTIDHHISAILSKLDVHSRSMAVSKAKELGLLK